MRVDQLYNVLMTPVFSEKATDLASIRKYVFKVKKDVYKGQVAMAVEKIFSVKVDKINIINIHPKKKNFKQRKGVRSGFKKAIVTLKEGYSLDLIAS